MSKSSKTVKTTVNVNVNASSAPSSTLADHIAMLAEKAAPIEPAHKRSGLEFHISADGQVTPDVNESTSASGRRTAALLGSVNRASVERLMSVVLSASDDATKDAIRAAMRHTASRVLRLWAVDGKPSVMSCNSEGALPTVVANRGEIESRKTTAKASATRTVEQTRVAIETRCLREVAFASAAVNGAIASAVCDLAQVVALDALRALDAERKAVRSAQRKLTAAERADMKARENAAHATLADAGALASVAAEQASALATETATTDSAAN